jgi:hypothetical protein
VLNRLGFRGSVAESAYRSPEKTRSHECEPGTHECVRHELGQRNQWVAGRVAAGEFFIAFSGNERCAQTAEPGSILVLRRLGVVYGSRGKWNLDSFSPESLQNPLAQFVAYACLIGEFGNLKVELEVERPIAEARV